MSAQHCRHSTDSRRLFSVTAGSAVLTSTPICCALGSTLFVLVECIAANIKFVLTALQKVVGDDCLWLTCVTCVTGMFIVS